MFADILFVVLIAGAVGQCLDEDANCPSWALNGFCTNPYYVSIVSKCKSTCNLCNAVCADDHPKCSIIVKNGFCSSAYYSSGQKKETCAKSCGLC